MLSEQKKSITKIAKSIFTLCMPIPPHDPFGGRAGIRTTECPEGLRSYIDVNLTSIYAYWAFINL